MKTKHTATPWRVAPDGATIHCGDEHDPSIVCSCDINDPMVLEIDDQEANAQFIVQACNHHEELIEALESILFISRGATDDGNKFRISEIAQSLLAKLKG